MYLWKMSLVRLAIPISTALLAVLLLASDVRAVMGTISSEIITEAQDKGVVRVIVKLALDEGSGKSIAEIQDAVLAELRGTDHRLLQRYINSPFLALEVGPDALARLGRSPHVLSVSRDFELRPNDPGDRPR
jgi:hypothetical protein